MSAFTLLHYVIQERIFFKGIVVLEREEATKDLNRCIEGMRNEVSHLDSLCHDRSAWNNTYEYVKDHNQAYVDSTLVLSSFTSNHLNVLALYDTRGERVWGKAYDLEAEQRISIQEFAPTLPTTHPLLAYPTDADSLRDAHVSGVMRTDKGLLLVASRPILTSENAGPIRGTLIMGKLFTEGFRERMMRQIQVRFDFRSADTPELSEKDRNALRKLTDESPMRLDESDRDLLHAYTVFPEATGAPGFLLRADIPRLITAQGLGIERFAIVMVLSAGLSTLLVLLFSIEVIVLRPLSLLTKHVASVASSKDTSARLPLGANDELGKLAEGVNRMLESIETMEGERQKMETRVRQGQKIASLNVMAGSIAHNFNNLLQVVLGYHALAREALPSNSEVAGFVEEANKVAVRAAELSTLMLTYVGQGKELDEAVDLSKLVEGLHLEKSFPAHVLFRQDLTNHLPVAKGDPQQIQSVIANLVSNALESLPNERGHITVVTGTLKCDRTFFQQTYLDEGQASGVYVYLEVSDTGCGMDEETKQRMFDPYFTTKFPGRGLGLAAVLGIVRGHNGAIHVASDPDIGTSVRVLFPALDRRIGERQERTTLPEHRSRGRDVAWRSKGTLLVVDDEGMVRSVVAKMLESWGFTVLTARDGYEGIPRFREHMSEIRCVLLDMTMPGMNGLRTLEELRNLKADVPVIITSGSDKQRVAERFARRNVAGIVQKPYLAKDLQAELQKALARTAL